ncbi:hypothetical protein [Catenulispora subtropica]|uniref:Methyltransferase type 11 n=1 Tax=Catenulispora subtropica TaxID=450798 RepID=A0ABN2RKR4_9ACTN
MSAETTAPDPADWLDYNRANWDERVPIHVDGDFYDVEGFVVGRETVPEFALAEVGDVRGKSLIHPQCHIGTETLGWARHGATVTGLDFSQPALDTASDLAEGIRGFR